MVAAENEITDRRTPCTDIERLLLHCFLRASHLAHALPAIFRRRDVLVPAEHPIEVALV